MVRMWGIDPRTLCHNHLLGEHNEMHMIVGTILTHDHAEAIAKGHAKKGQIDTSLIQQRHDDLATEMESRNMLHDSPLDYEDALNLGKIDVERSREMLREKDCPCLLEIKR